ncbi:hypothetical protein [Catellatospora sp. NPDC049133]|uniref:hypothetical protein n=1 Tax=Catellatospora sp. NPDC049133 TaxID=3155499 RepID=UPI0033C552C7
MPDAVSDQARQHLDELMDSLIDAHRVLARVSGHLVEPPPGGPVFDPESTRALVKRMAEAIEAHVELLDAAIAVIETGQPLAVKYASGATWGGPLTPENVLLLADHAAAGAEAMPFARGYADVATAEATDRTCRRGNGSCQGIRVRLVDGTRAAACWAHLNAEEKAAVKAEREAAMVLPCPTCGAESGAECVDTATGRTTTIHNDRLRPDAYSPAAGRPTRPVRMYGVAATVEDRFR